MVTLLTSTGDRELDTTGMPGTDTSDLAQTLVRLAGQLLRVPTRGDTLVTLALGDADDVDHLVLGKHILNGDRLLEVRASPVHLLGHGATVQLDLHNVSLLLALAHAADLGVHDHAHHRAVLLDALQVESDLALARRLGPLLRGLGESLLLGLVPLEGETKKNDEWRS